MKWSVSMLTRLPCPVGSIYIYFFLQMRVVVPLTVAISWEGIAGQIMWPQVTWNQQTFTFPVLFSVVGLSITTSLYNWKNKAWLFYAHMGKHSPHTWALYTPRILQGFMGYCNRSGKIQQECHVFLVSINDISQMFVWSLFSCNMTGKMLTSNGVVRC